MRHENIFRRGNEGRSFAPAIPHSSFCLLHFFLYICSGVRICGSVILKPPFSTERKKQEL